jgi:hypothetical protein
MSETIRIRTTPNGEDKYLKVKIDQEFDFIEVLSMKITQEEAYRNFCSDYGVIVGRVIINSGFGLPNAKVSVFLPIDDDDKNDTVTNGLYPYSIVTDKDSDGIRYNLLPKNSETNNECFTPIGTFPNKREILDNEELLHVYCKYYKFTTTTNNAGDFMIFGVPLGTYTIHVDADISDVGIASQRPYDLISQGISPKNFETPTKFKGGTNLDTLYQVKSTNYSVNVQPFWGEQESCEIGISRADIDMNYEIIPSAMFMGSIFGDQDKNSINKRCRPRKALGELCSQVAGEGTIEMIRETMDGGVESFDIDGGQLIDVDGAWAYQIPMNLDYVVTDEYGVLIPSDDPNKGLPTRASVRFKIGMENTGGEGRLRTRAKYLVPNNPENSSQIDYKFDETCKKTSFRSLYWNKIYTVSNFISRFQTRSGKTRAMTGVKNVDNCPGDKTPFPFNRVNTTSTPLFFIICLLVKIIGFLVWIMNKFIISVLNRMIWIINKLISAWNSFVDGICKLSKWEVDVAGLFKFKPFGGLAFVCPFVIPLIDYIPCIQMECSDEDPKVFAPGCNKPKASSDYDTGFNALESKLGGANTINFYPNDGIHGDGFGDLVGWDDCISFQMAKSMNIFQFDFYNDWVNGTLFGFLLKYKKKKRKRELFCEYDCNPDYFGQGGVDGNKNNVGDNNCHNNYLLDTGFNSDNNLTDNGKKSEDEKRYTSLREGLIKKIDTYVDDLKVGEEFYYAATKHNVSQKLFATDIVCLGSVFDCDWQGIPKLQPLLIPTSYKVPPDEMELTDDNKQETTGQVGLDGNSRGLFFSVNCLGVHSDYAQILNIRHMCEMGVDIDELDTAPDGTLIWPDNTLGPIDIEETSGRFFRDVFYDLNSRMPFSVGSYPNNPLPVNTNFNLKNELVYQYTSVGSNQNGADYIKFRGYPANTDLSFAQPKNSYFFYFGIIPGKGGLEKLNQKFFTRCTPVAEKEFNIIASTIAAEKNGNGSITFTVVSGTAPFTYTVSGPNGVSTGTLVIDPATGQPYPKVLNVPQGQYTIEVIDVNGNIVNQTINVDGPPPFYGSAEVTKMCTSASAADGEITIGSIGGGSGSWTYKLYKSNGSLFKGPASVTSSPMTIGGLDADTGSNGANPPLYGYKLVLSDGITSITIESLLVDGPTPVVLTVNSTKPTTCWESKDGEYSLKVTGGKGPYTYSVTGPASYNSITLDGITLYRGTYSATVVDRYGTTAALNFAVDSKNPQMIAASATAADLARQCDPNNYIIPFFVQTGAPIPTGSNPPLKINVRYRVNNASDGNGTPIYNTVLSTTNYVNGSTYVYATLPKTLTANNDLTLSFVSVDGLCFSNELKMNEAAIRLPNTTLGINFTNINNAKQCIPNVVTFKFNVSHWSVGGNSYMERAPYTFEYKINGYGPTGASSFFTETITSNQQTINTTIPTAAIPNTGGSTYQTTITYTITDNKGCTANGSFNITMPTQALSAQVSKSPSTVSLNGISVTTCSYEFTASGGIGTKIGSPYALTTNYDYATGYNIVSPSTFCSIRPIPSDITTITDSVGCTITKTT